MNDTENIHEEEIQKQEIDGCIWNVSNFVDKKEIEEKDDQELFMAKENSIKYWRKNEEDRFHHLSHYYFYYYLYYYHHCYHHYYHHFHYYY